MTDIKLCADCRHFRASKSSTPGANTDRCANPALAEQDYVRGEFKPIYCVVMRQDYGGCKPAGIHWQPEQEFFTISATEASHVSEF